MNLQRLSTQESVRNGREYYAYLRRQPSQLTCLSEPGLGGDLSLVLESDEDFEAEVDELEAFVVFGIFID